VIYWFKHYFWLFIYNSNRYFYGVADVLAKFTNLVTGLGLVVVICYVFRVIIGDYIQKPTFITMVFPVPNILSIDNVLLPDLSYIRSIIKERPKLVNLYLQIPFSIRLIFEVFNKSISFVKEITCGESVKFNVEFYKKHSVNVVNAVGNPFVGLAIFPRSTLDNLPFVTVKMSAFRLKLKRSFDQYMSIYETEIEEVQIASLSLRVNNICNSTRVQIEDCSKDKNSGRYIIYDCEIDYNNGACNNGTAEKIRVLQCMNNWVHFGVPFVIQLPRKDGNGTDNEIIFRLFAGSLITNRDLYINLGNVSILHIPRVFWKDVPGDDIIYLYIITKIHNVFVNSIGNTSKRELLNMFTRRRVNKRFLSTVDCSRYKEGYSKEWVLREPISVKRLLKLVEGKRGKIEIKL